MVYSFWWKSRRDFINDEHFELMDFTSSSKLSNCLSNHHIVDILYQDQYCKISKK